MPRFDKNNTKEFKEFLFNSCVHDAKLSNIEYRYAQDSIKIELINLTFNAKIELTFCNVAIMFTIKGKDYGDREAVLSLTIEEDYLYIQTCLPKHSEYMEDSIYLLLQMFSGDELHIISKEVIIDIT